MHNIARQPPHVVCCVYVFPAQEKAIKDAADAEEAARLKRVCLYYDIYVDPPEHSSAVRVHPQPT